MTQEALAEVIGVSAQTISKWENSTTYPDVALLPVIADVFDVTIDALYGRESVGRSQSSESAIEQVIEQVRRTFAAVCYDPKLGGSFDYELVLRPWGALWDDVPAEDLKAKPYFYEDWYLPLVEAGAAMPSAIDHS